MPDIHSLRELFRRFLASLVIRPRNRTRELPILLMLASQSPERDWLSNETRRYLTERRPCASIDMRDILRRSPGSNVPDSQQIVYKCIYQLSARRLLFGRLKFPRVAAAFVASSHVDLDGINRQRAESDLLELLKQEAEIYSNVKAFAPTLTIPIPFVGDLQIAGEGIRRWILTRRILFGRACRWYRTAFQELEYTDTPYETNLDALIQLNQWAKERSTRSRCDQVVMDAFLADLRDQFGRGLRGRLLRTQNCSVIIENADAIALDSQRRQEACGQPFLQELAAARMRYNNCPESNEKPGDPAIVISWLDGQPANTIGVLDDATATQPPRKVTSENFPDWPNRKSGTNTLGYYFLPIELGNLTGLKIGESLFRSNPLPPPRPSPWYFLLVGATVLALLAGFVAIVYPSVGRCSSGVYQSGPNSQCVGVTAGSYAFPDSASDLADIMAKIGRENQRVVESGVHFESIAYVVPLSSDESGLSVALRHELQGAYAAQVEKNKPADASSALPQPQVRLLIVNVGPDGSEWQRAFNLLADVIEQEHVIAVTGLGQSNDNTRAMIAAVREYVDAGEDVDAGEAGLPLVASRLTADDLADGPSEGPVEGLYRIGPTNGDQASAMAALLKRETPNGLTAVVVQDTFDAYAQDLGRAFLNAYPSGPFRLLSSPLPYSSEQGSEPSGIFGLMARNICILKPDVIYFAGRGAQLRTFISTVTAEACIQPLQLNIVTGDDGVDLATLLELEQEESSAPANLPENVSVRYTTLAHPGIWSEPESLTNPIEQDRFEQFTQNVFGENLSDGAAMCAYDAVSSLIAAIRATGTSDPAPREVNQVLKQLNNANSIGGVTGWISFDPMTGISTEKAIPVLRLQRDGSVTYDRVTSRSASPFVSPLVR